MDNNFNDVIGDLLGHTKQKTPDDTQTSSQSVAQSPAQNVVGTTNVTDEDVVDPVEELLQNFDGSDPVQIKKIIQLTTKKHKEQEKKLKKEIEALRKDNEVKTNKITKDIYQRMEVETAMSNLNKLESAIPGFSQMTQTDESFKSYINSPSDADPTRTNGEIIVSNLRRGNIQFICDKIKSYKESVSKQPPVNVAPNSGSNGAVSIPSQEEQQEDGYKSIKELKRALDRKKITLREFQNRAREIQGKTNKIDSRGVGE